MAQKSFTLGAVALAAAVTGAFAASGTAVAQGGAMEKCYGVAKPGENGCAHAKGLHSCAGISPLSFEGGDWKLVPAGSCEKENGSLKAFEGVNPKKKA
ncbi:MAG: DUF2282 domain-containing protein [Rhodospirillaceae bacterium]